MIYLIMYLGMLIFDGAILAGTAYYVDKGWTPWWFVFSFVMCVGSSPTFVLKFMRNEGKL